MHPFDHRIDGDDEPLPRRAIDESGVVAQLQPAGPGNRREKASDPAEFAQAFAVHGPLQIAAAQGAGEAVQDTVRQTRFLPAKERVDDGEILAHRDPRRNVGPMH